MRSIRERLNAMQPEVTPHVEPQPVGILVNEITAGRERHTERGSHFLVETSVPDPVEQSARWTDLIHLALEGIQHSRNRYRASDILFLDTETTGLDRGTGTHVFLVGIGYFSDGHFHVQQHFLRDLQEEPSLLCDLDELIREFPMLVTFNGRGFDWPMLTSRFILHGYRDIPEFIHWDLLTSSRRLWRNRLRDCSLGSLERQILGVKRIGDVPGYLIPDLYFDYLRTRDARPLRPVFSHNQEDIVSLAKLAERILLSAHDPVRVIEHPVDRVSWGLVLLNRGEISPAEELILPALDSPSITSGLRFRAFRSLAGSYKRSGNWSKAVALWQSMLRYRWDEPEQEVFPLVELAKVNEHRIKDMRQALRYTELALNVIDLNGWKSGRNELMHRYARLCRRLGTTNPGNRNPDGSIND